MKPASATLKAKSVQLSGPKESNILYPLFAILIFTLIVYLPALGNSLLLWDDHSYTWQNPFLKNFDFSRVFSFSTYYIGHYHPLTLLWLHLEYLIFPKGDPGLYGGLNPFWFHLNNILIHLLNTALVFYIVYGLRNRKEWRTAAVTALLFGIHPMHVESVAWVAELKDVLYSAFFLGSVLIYIRYLKTGRIVQLALAFLLFILSDLSKAQAITLPALLLVIDYYTGRKFSWKLIIEKIPFFILSSFFGLLAIKASLEVNAVNTSQTSILMNILNGCYSFLTYIFRMFIPANLCAVHPYLYNKPADVPFWFYFLPLVMAGLVAGAIYSANKTKEYLFGFLFYTVTISVMLKFVPVGDSMINERYTYVPFIGLFFIGGYVYSRFSISPRWKHLAHGIIILYIAAFTILSVQRIRTWKDNITFWEDVVRKYPDHWRGYYGLSVTYYNEGNFEKAFENANLACQKNPPAAPFVMRGTLYFDQYKNYDLAISDLRKALSFNEKNSPFNLSSHLTLGMAWFYKNDFARADTEYTRAILLDPENVIPYIRRGTLYADNLGRYDQALADFRQALYLDPAQKEAALGIGYCFYRKNLTAEAIAAFDKAIAMDTADGRLHYFRALALVQAQRYSEAYSEGLRSRTLGFNLNENDLQRWKALIRK